MPKVFGFSVLALFGLGVAAQRAEAVPVRCDTCRVDADFRAEAIRMDPGTHLVYNLGANVIQQYRVSSDVEGRREVSRDADAAGAGVQEPSPPPAAVEEVRRSSPLYPGGGQTLRPAYVVPIEILGLNPDARSRTAVDYVRDQNLRAMVESAMGNGDVISQVVGAHDLAAASDVAQLASNHTGPRDLAKLMFKVVFNDGSYVTVVVDPEHQNARSEPGSERTAAGQPIPG